MRQSFDEQADPSFGPQHLPLIRKAMAEQGLDGLIVPHEDEHQNEYLPAANDRLAWATGFTGSAGAAVILKDKAAIFVDGRYALQVRDQVDAGLFEVRDLVEGGVSAYLEAATARGQVIGFDPKLHSPDALDRLKHAAARTGAELRPLAANPLDAAWASGRGERITSPPRMLNSQAIEAGEVSTAASAPLSSRLPPTRVRLEAESSPANSSGWGTTGALGWAGRSAPQAASSGLAASGFSSAPVRAAACFSRSSASGLCSLGSKPITWPRAVAVSR